MLQCSSIWPVTISWRAPKYCIGYSKLLSVLFQTELSGVMPTVVFVVCQNPLVPEYRPLAARSRAGGALTPGFQTGISDMSQKAVVSFFVLRRWIITPKAGCGMSTTCDGTLLTYSTHSNSLRMETLVFAKAVMALYSGPEHVVAC